KALREHPRARSPALTPDVLTRAGTGIDARELQRRVSLDCRREIRRPLEPDRPGAVVAPACEQLVRDLAVELGRSQPEEVVPEQVLGDHRRVRLELSDPPAVGMLELEQALSRTFDRQIQSRRGSVRCECHSGSRVISNRSRFIWPGLNGCSGKAATASSRDRKRLFRLPPWLPHRTTYSRPPARFAPRPPWSAARAPRATLLRAPGHCGRPVAG